MTFENLLRGRIDQALDFMVKAVRKELDAQGHKATGNLIDSVEKKLLLNLQSGEAGQILIEKYGLYLDGGVPTHKIKYSPYWLLPWARIVKPSLSDRELKSFVFAVWSAHKREGIPTEASKKWSKNGRRKEWSKYAIEQREDEIGQILQMLTVFEAMIDEALVEAKAA